MSDIRSERTPYGFIFGAAEVERNIAIDGRVSIGIKTPRRHIEVYVTRTGLIRVFTHGGPHSGREWKEVAE